MQKQNDIETCTKCYKTVHAKNCPNCGNPRVLKRIDKTYILNEIGSVVNFDRGILYTIKELLIRPGITTRKFILEDRNRLVKPIIFLILCSFVYTVARNLLHFEDGYEEADMPDSALITIFGWIQNNYGYANIFMGIFIGFWTKVLFRKEGFNIYEILILIFFTMGIGMLIYTFFGIVESLTNFKVLYFASLITMVYSIWAIGSFFGKHKALNYAKALLSFFLGWITAFIPVIAIGVIIDLVTN